MLEVKYDAEKGSKRKSNFHEAEMMSTFGRELMRLARQPTSD